jgi:hypothetical protein
MATTAPLKCSGRRSMIPLPSERHYRRSDSPALVLPGLRHFYLAGEPKVVFMAYPGPLS